MIAESREYGYSENGYEWCSTRLIEILQPSGNRLTVSLEAYFDETERSDGMFCVAGLAFAPAQAKKLAKKWHQIIGDRVFHAREFFGKRGDFSELSQCERDKILKQLVKSIHKRESFAVAVGCNIQEIESLDPSILNSRQHAYVIGVNGCMHLLARRMREEGAGTKIAYVFEAGHFAQSQGDMIANEIRKHADDFAYQSHAFQSKEDCGLLQVADLFVWEFGKFISETLKTPQRGVRRSFSELLRGMDDRFIHREVTNNELKGHIERQDAAWRQERAASKG